MQAVTDWGAMISVVSLMMLASESPSVVIIKQANILRDNWILATKIKNKKDTHPDNHACHNLHCGDIYCPQLKKKDFCMKITLILMAMQHSFNAAILYAT